MCARQVNNLKVADRLRRCQVTLIRVQYLPQVAKVFEALRRPTRAVGVDELITKKVSEAQLEVHRRGGHRHFMPACAECRAGAITQQPNTSLP